MTSLFEIKPFPSTEVVEFGWYIHLDLAHQKTKNMYGTKPYGAWFFEFTKEGWRDEVGCLDCGPLDKDDLIIGPINMGQENRR